MGKERCGEMEEMGEPMVVEISTGSQANFKEILMTFSWICVEVRGGKSRL